MAKYNNSKIKIDGKVFDSKIEYDFFLYLQHMQENGIVVDFKCQPKFTLIPKYEKYGKTIRAITYTPDYYVKYSDGREEYIDVKGMGTPASELRRKLFDYTHPHLTLRWICKSIKYGDEYGWIDYDELNKIKKTNRRNK